MGTDTAVARIARRFGTDRLEICGNVKLVRNQLTIDEQEIVELNALLTRHGLEPRLPERKTLHTNQSLSPEELVKVTKGIDRVVPAVDTTMSDLHRRIDETALLLT